MVGEGTAGNTPGNAGTGTGEAGAGKAAAAPEAEVKALIEKHGNDVNKIAAELFNMNKSHGEATNKLGELRKELEAAKGSKQDDKQTQTPETEEMKSALLVLREDRINNARDGYIEKIKQEPYFSVLAPEMGKLIKEDPVIRAKADALANVKIADIQSAVIALMDEVYVKAFRANTDKIAAFRAANNAPFGERPSATKNSGGSPTSGIQQVLQNYIKEKNTGGGI